MILCHLKKILKGGDDSKALNPTLLQENVGRPCMREMFSPPVTGN